MNQPLGFIVAGKAGSGKDYTADYLINKGVADIRLSLAEPIKWIINKDFDKNGREARPLYQHFGTEIARHLVDDELWLKIAWARVLAKPDKIHVISDARFINEIEFFNERNWITIKLDVEDSERRKKLLERDGFINEEALNHSSEKEVDEIESELIITHAYGQEYVDQIDKHVEVYKQLRNL